MNAYIAIICNIIAAYLSCKAARKGSMFWRGIFWLNVFSAILNLFVLLAK